VYFSRLTIIIKYNQNVIHISCDSYSGIYWVVKHVKGVPRIKETITIIVIVDENLLCSEGWFSWS